jgi:acetyl/propionyl-CoA carboxylase alpha subunit
MRYYVTIGERVLVVELGPEGTRVDGRPVSASLEHADGTPVRGLVVDGCSHRVVADRRGRGRWRLHLGAGVVDADVVDERTKAIRELAGSGAGPAGPAPIVAPMPGMVVKVEVAEGDRVEAGQGVAIVEAMKMENELRASGPGVVTRVHVREGDAVEKDQVLVDLAPLAEAEA